MVIAIIAILAAILFPVFAQAKTAAKVTASLSNVKQLAIGLHIYSTDYDDMVVPEYGYSTVEQPTLYSNGNTWVGRVYPYVKNRGVYWDRLKTEPSGDMHFDPFFSDNYRWEWVTNLSLNTDGYSRHWTGTGCTAINWSGEGNYRSQTAFEDPAKRMALAPVRYANLPYGWMRFYAIDASWPTIDRYASGWDWYQLIWDARREYPGARMVAGFADGHAGKIGRGQFVGYSASNPSTSDATTYAQYCTQMDNRQLWSLWGRPWQGD